MRTSLTLLALLLTACIASAGSADELDFTSDAFDPILFPVFSPPVHGQNGTEFRTIAKLWNKSRSEVLMYGFDLSCTLLDPPIFPELAVSIPPRGDEQAIFTNCSETAGRIFFVPKGDTESIATSLRVQEMTRQGENHGVEIPVARRKDFSDTSIALVGVPNDPRFRLTLRVYSLGFGGISTVKVTVLARDGQVGSEEQLALLPGPARTPFEPSYAAFTGFLPAAAYGEGDLTVLVENQAPNSPPIWAFITVTNNVTQHITTVTPN